MAFGVESTLLKCTIGVEIQEGSVFILMKAFVYDYTVRIEIVHSDYFIVILYANE